MARPWKPIKHPLENQYRQQMRNAWKRGIEWKLTFRQWLRIWTESGHLHERGKLKHQYVMARFGDEGAYEVGNVKIITHEENCREGSIGNAHAKGIVHSAETRKKFGTPGNQFALGHRLSKKIRAKISRASKARWKDPEYLKKMKNRGNQHTARRQPP